VFHFAEKYFTNLPTDLRFRRRVAEKLKRVTRDGKLLSHTLHGRMPLRELHLGKLKESFCSSRA
jgi:hypothetical protein